MRGTVDFKSDTVELGGTYVPLYGLNSALGSIPILGSVLVGRKGEGVVGITFAIKGKLDDPTVLINPMSVMTPGIFRQIFEFTGSAPEARPPRRHSDTRKRLRHAATALTVASDWPDQHVTLLAERELDHAFLCQIVESQHPASSLTARR